MTRGRSRHRPRNDARLFENGTYPFIQTGDVANSDGRIRSADKFYGEFGLSQSRLFPAGTLCITIAANIANTAILDIDACFPDSVVGVIVDKEVASTEYLEYLMRTVKDDLCKFAPATAQKNINNQILSDLQLPMPPLDEQHRIVARIGELTARSKTAKEALQAIPPLLEKFRQSVLAAAFRGDLTAEWRDQNPEIESGEALLGRIALEQRRIWMEAGSRGRFAESPAIDPRQLPQLPRGWSWTSVSSVLSELRNGIPDKPDQESGLRILRISAVRPNNVDTSDVRFLKKDMRYSGYALQQGDLLFTRYNGNRDFVGVCGVVGRLQAETVYPDKLIRGRVIACDPEFIAAAVNSGVTRAHIESCAKTAAGQWGISGGDIRATPVPVPPLAEQRVITQYLRGLKASLLLQSKWLETGLERLRDTESSILSKAFRGELVPRDQPRTPAHGGMECRAMHAQSLSSSPGFACRSTS